MRTALIDAIAGDDKDNVFYQMRIISREGDETPPGPWRMISEAEYHAITELIDKGHAFEVRKVSLMGSKDTLREAA